MISCKKCGIKYQSDSGDIDGICEVCKLNIHKSEIIINNSSQLDCRVSNANGGLDQIFTEFERKIEIEMNRVTSSATYYNNGLRAAKRILKEIIEDKC